MWSPPRNFHKKNRAVAVQLRSLAPLAAYWNGRSDLDVCRGEASFQAYIVTVKMMVGIVDGMRGENGWVVERYGLQLDGAMEEDEILLYYKLATDLFGERERR